MDFFVLSSLPLIPTPGSTRIPPKHILHSCSCFHTLGQYKHLYQGLSLNWSGHCNSQATWGLRRAFRHELKLSTCDSHHGKRGCPGTLPRTQCALCDCHCHGRVLGPKVGWGGSSRAISPTERAYSEPAEPTGFSQQAPYTAPAKTTEQEGYQHPPARDSLLGAGEKKLPTRTPTRTHQAGFQGCCAPTFQTTRCHCLKASLHCLKLVFPSLIHETLQELIPTEGTCT